MERTFYETVIKVKILTEDPVDYNSLESIAYDMRNGDAVGQWDVVSQESINAQEAADALYEMGSEPGFFMIEVDEEGHVCDEEV